jgi:hypothetical protein
MYINKETIWLPHQLRRCPSCKGWLLPERDQEKLTYYCQDKECNYRLDILDGGKR